MKCLKLLKVLPFFVSVCILGSACNKAAVTAPIGDAGKTLVKVISGGTLATPGYKLLNVELKNTPQTLSLVDIRRDIPSNAELNRTMNVVVKDDAAAVTAYNSALIPLPAGSYTIDPATPLSGSDYKFAFTAGEFAKEIKVTLLNALSLSLSSRYALGFTLTSVDANGVVLGDQKTIVVEIGVKNKWHGDYVSNGYLYHPAAPRSIDNLDKQVLTSGANTVTVFLGDLGGAGYKATFTINADNSVSIATAPGAAGGAYTMFSSGLPSSNPGYTPNPGSNPTIYSNRYDPATQTFYVRYGYMGGSGWRVTEEAIKKK